MEMMRMIDKTEHERLEETIARIESQARQMDFVEVGQFLFMEFIKSAHGHTADGYEIWTKHYKALPSYVNCAGQEYFEKMRDKYLLTYEQAMREMHG